MLLENQRLHSKIKQNQIEINKLIPYNRSSFILELSGILWQNDENVIDLVNSTAVIAGICNFDVSQIDIRSGFIY